MRKKRSVAELERMLAEAREAEKPAVQEQPPPFPEPPKFRDSKREKTDLLRFPQRLKERIFLWRKKRRKVLVEMNLTSGGILFFVAYVRDRLFVWKGKEYVVDESQGKYCFNQKKFMYRYHEAFALPIQWSVDADKLMGSVPVDSVDIRTSFNPGVLRDVLKFEYAKAVIKGAEVSEIVKRMFIVVVIVGVIALAHFVVNAYKGGWI